MQILPVLDLKSRQVVRGIAGLREQYRPIQSILSPDAAVASVGHALVQHFGFSSAYVADLDAIAGAEPDWDSYRQLTGCGLRLWIDAGIRNLHRARQLAAFTAAGQSLQRVVVALETLPEASLMLVFAAELGDDRLVFSLDLKHGRPITAAAEWAAASPDQIADAAWSLGARSLIVLDLARVGTGQGSGTETLCRNLRGRYPDAELIGGGGVRALADLRQLATAGYDRALVASALHDGRLQPSDLAEFT